MKKFTALVLALALTLALFAGCNNSNDVSTPSSAAPSSAAPTPSATASEPPAPSPDGPSLTADGRYPAETVKIGFVNYDTTATQVLSLHDYFSYLQTAFNFEIIWSESLSNAEQEFEFIERCAAAGAKAIIGYYNEGLGESGKLCESLGMYYWGGAESEPIYEPNRNNPYYLGGYYSGSMNYDFGYTIAEALVANDCHKIIVMSGGKDYGVPFFVQRYQGIMDGIADAKAKNYDIEMVYEVPGWPGTEAFAAHQTAALQTDADGLAGTLTCMMWLQPMQVAGKFGQIKIASIDDPTEEKIGLMQAGVYVAICAEIFGVFGLSIPMILNAVDGYADLQRNPDGTAPKINVNNWVITNIDDMTFYAGVDQPDGIWTFDVDDVKSILYAFNDSVTIDDMSALYSATSANDIRARRAG